MDKERLNKSGRITESNSSSTQILLLIIIFTVLGNTLVLVATWREKRLHQPNKYFVACLAVADLLVGILLAPTKLYKDYQSYEWLPSIHFCRFMAWIDTVALAASIYTLTFISIDRYVKISKPLQYKSRMTTSTSVKIIFSVWLISFGLGTCILRRSNGILGRSNGILGTGDSSCNKENKNFYIFLAIIAFFLPIVVMMVMYVLIYIVTHKRQKMLRNGQLGQMLNDQNQRATFLQDLKVIRLFLLVIGVFIFCWLPYFVYLFYIFDHPNFFDPDIYSALNISHWSWVLISTAVASVLPLFNSLCNPIIYACLHDQTYKKAFNDLFKRILCRARREPPNLNEIEFRSQIRT
ncbi:5-hydroxytryptamine receptor 1-like [Paramuricea clavata]|uniref:5-hydroxytryptamine receptor 1-like n=1 Tax=Paramuricea clavata TaxID=317549 RepID=A0A6S7K492_PARCT|nr:5-hydroxytryptamine receptor 1-like [Paramuricea clavata]